MAKRSYFLILTFAISVLAGCAGSPQPTLIEPAISPALTPVTTIMSVPDLTTVPVPASTDIPTPVPEFATYTDISVREARGMIEADGNVLILDVRTEEEWDSGHVDGAVLVPLSELENRVGELDKSRKTIVYCMIGVRSPRASMILIDAGFQHVYNMTGGIDAWKEAGYPVTTG